MVGTHSHWRVRLVGGLCAAMLAACGGASTSPSSAGPAPSDQTSTTESTTTTVATTTTTIDPAIECRRALSLERRVGLVLMPLAEPSTLDEVVGLAQRGLIGGVALLGRPGAALGNQIAAIKAAAAPYPFVVSAGEEGGKVQRLSTLLGAFPSAQATGASSNPAAVRARAEAYGAGMIDLGVDMRLAPVADVGGGPGIGNRSFGSDPDAVSAFVVAEVEGTLAGGVIPVVKHFPGHGRASGDSHDGLPTTPAIDELRTVDLLPFIAAFEADPRAAVMTAHLAVPGLTDGGPASLSPAAVNGLLRDELGFDGLAMSDALNMDAIVDAMGPAEASRLALVAGNDIVLLGSVSEVEAVHRFLLDAIVQGTWTENDLDDHVRRILHATNTDACALAIVGSPTEPLE